MTDIIFGPTSSGKMYTCLSYHRCARATRNKRCWAIARPLEYSVFEWADDVAAFDEGRNLWGFLFEDGELAIVGTEGERIARFPAPSNESDDWHGYPVHAQDLPARRPSPTFIESLYARALLNKVQKKRIQDSRL